MSPRAGLSEPPRLPRTVPRVIAVAPVLLYASIVPLPWVSARAFDVLTREDGVLEYLQVVMLLASSLLSGLLALRLRRDRAYGWSLLYTLLCGLMILAAGEEISWGQRLLGVQTPAWYAAHNHQGETTLHNLHGVQQFQAPVTAGALVLLGGLSAWGWGRRRRAYLWATRLYRLIPHPMVLPGWICGLVYIAARPIGTSVLASGPTPILDRLQEPGELILVTSVVVFLAHVRWLEHRRLPPSSPDASSSYSTRACATANHT